MSLDEIRTTGYHQQHGAFISPGLRGNSPATGNGDYREWLEYEADQANREAERERIARYEPPQDWTPVDEAPVKPEAEPTWQLDWLDRWRITLAVYDTVPRLSNETWQEHLERQTEAVNCTAFARSFERWIDAGCPTTKGTK